MRVMNDIVLGVQKIVPKNYQKLFPFLPFEPITYLIQFKFYNLI